MSAENQNDIAYWSRRIQPYLDGTLPRREAVQLFLYAERHPQLRAELDSVRQLMTGLDGLPREEPSAGFDARVLESIPVERYATAPRKPLPVLEVGGHAPPLWARTLRRFRGGISAAMAAYALFLVVSHSFLADSATAAAASVGEWLGVLVARTQGVPVLSTVVGGAAQALDLLTTSVGWLSNAWGVAAVTVLLGAVLGAGVVFALRWRRRQVARSTHA